MPVNRARTRVFQPRHGIRPVLPGQDRRGSARPRATSRPCARHAARRSLVAGMAERGQYRAKHHEITTQPSRRGKFGSVMARGGHQRQCRARWQPGQFVEQHGGQVYPVCAQPLRQLDLRMNQGARTRRMALCLGPRTHGFKRFDPDRTCRAAGPGGPRHFSDRRTAAKRAPGHWPATSGLRARRRVAAS